MARINSFLTVLVLALAVAAGLASTLIPLYSDEIAVQMVRARFFAEGGRLLNLLPQCHSLAASVPISLYPGAVFNAIVYAGASDVGLRIRGILICMAWLSILWMWAGRHPQTTLPRRSFQGLAISLSMVGVLPFVMVLTRPEQLLILGLVAYCLFPLFWRFVETEGRLVKCSKAILFLLITSVFLLAHPKALFFTPLIMASAWLTFRDAGFAWRVGILVVSSLLIFQSLQFTQKIAQCPDAPLMGRVLAQHTLDFSLLATDRPALVAAVQRNLSSAPSLIFGRVPVTSTFQSNWLPSMDPLRATTLLPVMGGILKGSLYCLALLLLCGLAFMIALALKRRRIHANTLLGLALTVGLIGHLIIYNVNAWHFYTPGLIIPILIILFLLLLHEAIPKRRWVQSLAAVFASYWLLLAIGSLILLLATVAPKLVEVARLNGFVIAGQPLSTPVFLSDERRAELLGLASQCKIKDGDARLVVDGAAYFAFQSGRQPINVLYVSDYAFGMDVGPKIPELLKKLDSSGMISRCEYLPKAFRDKAITSGDMCCVPKSVWQSE